MWNKNVKLIKLLLIIAFFFGFFFNLPVSYSQLSLKPENMFDLGDVGLFSEENYQNTITRQNSCTIYLTDFIFAEPMEGKFLVDLVISFISSQPGSMEPSNIKKYRTLFSDVIEVTKENEAIELSLHDKKLIENFNLSDVTDIKIEIKLVRKKSEGTDTILKLVKPLMDKVTDSSPIFKVFDNLLLNVQDPNKKKILLFYADFRVPQNVFEFKKLETSESVPLIRNNEKYAIVLSGKARIPKADSSVVGNVYKVINDITNYFSGKEVIEPDKVRYEGLVKLFFTKDATSLLPNELVNGMKEIDRALDKAQALNLSDIEKEIQVKISEVYNDAEFKRRDKIINEQTCFSITEYLKLSKIYLSYLECIDELNKSQNNNWNNGFEAWTNNIDIKGAMYQFQAIGIKKIYNNKLAKIYIPYSLGDDLILSFYQRQVCMHQYLESNKDNQLARDFP